MQALHSILGMQWQDRVTNLEVLDHTDSTNIEAIFIKAQLWWIGHVICMDKHHMPRRLLYGELVYCKRNQGCPKKCYKDTVKAKLLGCNIKPKQLEEYAGDRSCWQATANSASNNFEETWHHRQRTASQSYSSSHPDI